MRLMLRFWPVFGDVHGVLLLVRHPAGLHHGVVLALRVGRHRYDPDSRPVCADFRPPAGDLAVVEAEGDDRVRLAFLGLVDHAAHGLVAALEQELRHLGDLAPADRAQAGREAGADVARPDRDAEDFAEDGADLVPGNIVSGDDEHRVMVGVGWRGPWGARVRSVGGRCGRTPTWRNW